MIRKNEKDTLTGLLALSADKSQMEGQCCSDEELALLVEGNMDTESRQKCMEHLGHCERCYSQWLFLKKEEENSKKKIIPFLSKKSYKYIGSSLALAASVVVFLNVYRQPIVEVAPGPENSVIVDKKNGSHRDRQAEPKGEIGGEQIQAEEQLEKLSAPLIKMQKNSSHGKAERKVLKRESVKPAEKVQLLESIAPVATTYMRSQTVESSISLTKNEFYQMIAEGCKKRDFDQKYWSNLRVRGTKILPKQSTDTSLDSQLVKLLAGMKQETWQQQCAEIAQLLAKEITPINKK